VTTLADAVLPLIRTRADLSRWSASNAHGRQIHEAVDNLDAAIPTTDPAEVYAVTHKVLASGIKVIARADDFSGIIGDACRRLLELHPTVAAAAQVPAGSLVDWMVRSSLTATPTTSRSTRSPMAVSTPTTSPTCPIRCRPEHGHRRCTIKVDPATVQIFQLPAMVNPDVLPQADTFGGMSEPVNQNGFSDISQSRIRVTDVV
jgi:hypothetical protein